MASFLSWMLGGLSASLLGTFSLTAQTTPAAFSASLDPRAEVYYPGSEKFASASLRWDASQTPTFDLVVKVTTEEDVQKTILYANAHKKPFLAISGGHGTMSSISKLKNGVGIFLRDMSNMTVVDNGQAVLLGGGVQSGDVISYLWSHGKQTTTTGCDCVGYVGPILGGGHGWLQGRYGLASDQLISARMVLANGTAISVSNEENKDLFWAIRGAGHNFGVVTQVKMRIYDREKEQDEWAASSFVYTHDKMESVFGLMNSWLDDVVQPEGLVHYGLFVHNADVDPDNPIVIIWVYYQAAFIPRQYVDALNALSPIAVENKVTDLAGVNAHVQADRNGTSCAKGFSRSLVPVSLHRYSLPALRKVVSIFAALPAAYRNSALMLEGFPVNRVHQILAEDSAYPDRGGRLLVSPVLTNVHEKSLDEGAWRITGEIRSALVEGNGGLLVAYVNYARGDETLEEVYGHEAWRLEKLRKLKKAFDPFGRFNFAMPIT